VSITGTDFTGATAVHFGSANAASFIASSATSLTAVAPAGTGTQDVTVTATGGTSATGVADLFGYVAPAAGPATIAAAPLGPPTPSGGWNVAYGDAFATTLGTGAGQDNTWAPRENDNGFNNSTEVELMRARQDTITPEGLDLRCTYSPTEIANGKHYECGAVNGVFASSANQEYGGYRTPIIALGKGQTLAFQCVCKFPVSGSGQNDVGWWMDGPPWNESEFDFFEAFGKEASWDMYSVWFASPYVALDKFGLSFDPAASFHTYTVEVVPGSVSGRYRYSEWIDGQLQTLQNQLGGYAEVTASPEITANTSAKESLMLSYALRPTGFTSGSRDFLIRSATVYEDTAHAGVGIEDGGLAPGTSVS
jgi:hypothetical protein